MLLYPLSFTYQPRNELGEREVRTNKIDRINQLLKAVSLVNWVVSKNSGNQVGERTGGRVLTQAKGNSYVSLEQEARSVEAAKAHFAEQSSFVADNLESCISREYFLSFIRL